MEAEQLDASRLALETALMIDKMDVHEETVRLSEHVKACRALIHSGEARGKKLDFYCQELLREVNTIGSKSQLASLTQVVSAQNRLSKSFANRCRTLNKKNVKMVIVIGPTAVGKSRMIDDLLRDYPNLCDIITYTTRPMRAGESEGNPYHFVSEERFKELLAKDHFIETAIVHGRMYGTPRDQVENTAINGRCCVMDIDVQGAKKLMKEYPSAVTIFLMPPSVDALRERFIKRGVTSEADLSKRLESARLEMAQAHDFEHVIINDNFEVAYAEIRKIVEKLLKNQ